MAKTRKKKKAPDTIHIDINSHNAKGRSKYKMLDAGRNLKFEDIYDGSRFSYAGKTYDIVEMNETHHVFSYGVHYGQIYKATKTGIYLKILFWNKSCSTFVSFKNLYFVS